MTRWLVALCLAWGAAGCGDTRPAGPPSLLLFVADTTRADAVSAYGQVDGTTPEWDALANAGLRYEHAYANAPWTLPSHTTLFSGRLPHEHRVDWQRPRVPASLALLAEMLRDAGYQTAGFSENPFVSRDFGLARGFETFFDPASPVWNLDDAVRTWAAERDASRPFFVFVNVMDAHWPYAVREQNPFLPPDVDADEARALSQWPPDYFCPQEPRDRGWAIQRGLYLGDVAAADARLGRVRRLLDTPGLITVATSDHGEHLGEHGLANHQFSVHEPVLRVPLVVHGLAGTRPGVVTTPVQLADLVPSVLAWTGLPARPELSGRPLPTTPGASAPARVLRADYRDPASEGPDEPRFARMVRAQARVLRSHCPPDALVWGDMTALILYPMKLLAFDRFPARLYDLRDDPGEEQDLAARDPKLVDRLLQELGSLPGRGQEELRRPAHQGRAALDLDRRRRGGHDQADREPALVLPPQQDGEAEPAG